MLRCQNSATRQLRPAVRFHCGVPFERRPALRQAGDHELNFSTHIFWTRPACHDRTIAAGYRRWVGRGTPASSHRAEALGRDLWRAEAAELCDIPERADTRRLAGYPGELPRHGTLCLFAVRREGDGCLPRLRDRPGSAVAVA